MRHRKIKYRADEHAEGYRKFISLQPMGVGQCFENSSACSRWGVWIFSKKKKPNRGPRLTPEGLRLESKTMKVYFFQIPSAKADGIGASAKTNALFGVQCDASMYQRKKAYIT
jgi:hypothetical protein